MGWTFTNGQTKKELIKERTSPYSWVTEDGKFVRTETLKHTVTGANLWKVQRRTIDGVETDRYIALDLIGTHGGYGWGYKDLDESVGPCEVNCPLSYLDGLPEPINEWAREWRDRVRAFHAERKKQRDLAKSLAPGDSVTIYGKEYVVYHGDQPRGSLTVKSKENGMIYKARAKQLTLKEE